jgi:hypothetical protein
MKLTPLKPGTVVRCYETDPTKPWDSSRCYETDATKTWGSSQVLRNWRQPSTRRYFRVNYLYIVLVTLTDFFFRIVWHSNLLRGFLCLVPLLTIFRLYRGGQFYLVEETEVLGENHWSVVSHWQTLSHNVVSSTPIFWLWACPEKVITKHTVGLD